MGNPGNKITDAVYLFAFWRRFPKVVDARLGLPVLAADGKPFTTGFFRDVRKSSTQTGKLNRNRQEWYTMVNLPYESDFPRFRDNTASFGFDPRFIRVNPRLISLFLPISHRVF